MFPGSDPELKSAKKTLVKLLDKARWQGEDGGREIDGGTGGGAWVCGGQKVNGAGKRGCAARVRPRGLRWLCRALRRSWMVVTWPGPARAPWMPCHDLL